MSSSVSPRDIVRQLVRGGGYSIAIKVANGVLAYAMLLIIARVTTAEQYGIFAIAFSVAMSASYVAALGQPWAINRFWPEWMALDESVKARRFLRLSMLVTAAGMGIALVLMLLGGALKAVAEVPWSFAIAAATGLFTLALGWAEFAASGLRAQGYIVFALFPRDVAWRLVVCAIFGMAMLAELSFRAEYVVLVLGAILILVISPQVVMLARSSAGAGGFLLPPEERRGVSRYSAIMWLATVADLAKNYAGVLIVSAYLGAETAGAYFAAERTANILLFVLLAINLVSMPQISRYFHSDRREFVRLIVGYCGLAAGAAALAGLLFFVLFGGDVLAFFNPAYAEYLPILLILCLGQFFLAAAGPVGPLLKMSGYEQIDLAVIVSVGFSSVAVQALAGFYWGATGVALGAAAGNVATGAISVAYARRKLEMDPTGLSIPLRYGRKFFRLLRKSGELR